MYSTNIKQILMEIEEEAIRPYSRPKPPPKNYMKENFKRLKDIQDRAKKKDAEKQTLQPLRATHQYKQVQSKVLNMVKASGSKSETPDCHQPCPLGKQQYRVPPKTADPCRGRAPRSPCLSARSLDHRSLTPSKSLPQLYPHGKQQESDQQDDDTSCVDSPDSSSSEKQKQKSEVPHRPGHIPAYLIERKKKWQKEKERQIKLLEEASIPPGHTLLPDDERIETLELLIKNREEILQSLAALPVRSDTLRLKRYKEELERQLAKVEEGIKIFSRPKVLIKNDT